MKILKVIHGYPPRYNAGSEIYSKLLVNELSKYHDVQVLTRYENIYEKDFVTKIEFDLSTNVVVNLINMPRLKYRMRYVNQAIDNFFEDVLDSFAPDIVHFGHLSHLSVNLPRIAKSKGLSTIFTIHDYWTLCLQGQLIQKNSEVLWDLCDGPEIGKCAKMCCSGNYSGKQDDIDHNYWKSWVASRNESLNEAIDNIDLFISPSQFVGKYISDHFRIPSNRIEFLDYGFDVRNFSGKIARDNEVTVFGYIGTHTPQKGINLLIEAFLLFKKFNPDSNAILKIWGFYSETTSHLLESLNIISKSLDVDGSSIVFAGGYQNQNLMDEVFKLIDVLVVPSIWSENSPLVIHEANQARVPVITANYGGMAEYILHEVNGLLFKHRDVEDLARKIEMLDGNFELITKLGTRGYIYSETGDVITIQDHARTIEKLYLRSLP